MSLNPESRAALERLQTKWAREQAKLAEATRERQRDSESDKASVGYQDPTLWQKALSYLKSYWELVRG